MRYADTENLDFCFEMSFNRLKESTEGYDLHTGRCARVYSVKAVSRIEFEFYLCTRTIRKRHHKEKTVYKDCNHRQRKDLDDVSFKKC